MKSAPKKSSATADIKKNRLYITIAGKLSKKDLDRLYTDIRFCVADLADGFDVINDLSGCTLAALNGIPTFKKITNHLIDNEVGKVVRVVDERKIIFRQMLNVAAKMQGYKAIHVNSLEEAEQELFNAQKQDGLRFCLLDQPVAYIIDGEEGKGEVADISVSGCAISHDSFSPTMNELISFSTTFQKHENLLEVFETEAKVVWVENNKFAVSFQKIDNDLRDQMAERLIFESKRELN